MYCIGRTCSYVETIYKTTLLPLMAKSTRGRYEGVIRTAIVEKKKLKGESNDQKTANVNL